MNLFILSLVSTVFVLETALCFTIRQNTTDEKNPIIGGYIVADRIGFHVSLRCRNRYFCAGSLITPQHVLTAAHCITFIERRNCFEDVVVLAGSNDRNRGYYIPATTFFKHPGYFRGIEEHDIGVIKIRAPFPISDSIYPIKLAPYPPTLYEPFTVTGYGRVHPETHDYSMILRAYDNSLLTYEECYRRNGYNVHPTDICDLGERNVGTCEGDSGGPVFYGEYLIAVVSRGLSPKNPITGVAQCTVGYPNIFTSVYYHLDFINSCLIS